MNPVRKVYCRIFQQCFHIAIPFLPYREPKIMRNIEDLVPLLKKKHITRVLLVTDKGIRNLGITSYLEDAFKKRKIYTVVYDNTVANPTIDNVEEARKLYIKEQCPRL